MKPQPKFVTKLFAAIDGYAGLKAQSEKQALDLSHSAREKIKPLIEQYNGVWIYEKDGEIFANFKLPEDAVNTAVAIQQALQNKPDMKLRIGIHTGDIKSGAGAGDVVASGIAVMAAPGGVCISDKVYAAVQNKVDVKGEFLEETRIEDVERPIRVYALVGDGLAKPVDKDNVKAGKMTIKPSIAVLPFVDMSPEKDQEWFCDGVAEEIINALTHVQDILVVARTSAFSFKGKYIDIRELGAKLNVNHVLEGSVRKAGNRIRISAQLIKVDDGYHLWSEKYDRQLEDIFEIQDEMSLAIADKLKGALLKEEKKSIQKRYTSDTEAYQYYLMGTHFALRFDQDNAVHFLHKALAKDPAFPLPYTVLSVAYCNMAYQTYKPAREVMPLAKEAAQKSISLDNTLAEAYIAMCTVNWVYDWDWDAAEYHSQKALELNPGSSFVQGCNVAYQEKLGRSERAEQSLKQALESDPLSVAINVIALDFYRRERRVKDAKKIYQKMQEIDPNAVRIHMCYGKLYCELGEYEKALQILNREKEIAGEYVWLDETLGYTYACAGMMQQAQNILNKLIGQREKQYVKPTAIAFVYMGLGDIDNTFIWLEKGFDERDPHMTHLYAYPEWELIRSDPRFKALLRKMRLPEG